MIKQRKFKNIAFLFNSLFIAPQFKVFLCLGIFFIYSKASYAQVEGNQSSADSLIQTLARPIDSLLTGLKDSLLTSDLDTTVVYNAEDSTVMDVDGEKIYLYGNAVVDYGDIQLKADFIRLDWGKNEVFAHGLPDSTREVGEKVSGKPIFIQGGTTYNADTIRYNFGSKKAFIHNITTQEGEGIIHGDKVKKDAMDNMYLVDAKYSTCNLAEPHFHIAAKKIKLVNKKSIISGPFNVVLADVPLPIGFPFGYFPVPKTKEIGTSGFIMGSYGEEPRDRGFYLRDFGYYHAFNEYIGAKILGQIYTKGSWGLGVQSQYLRRYKYSGNVNVQFNYNKPGDEFSSQAPSKDFNISWSHSPQNKRPDRSFSASVNLVSNSFNQNNRRLDAVDQYTSNTFGSSIQYTKNFGKLIRTSTSIRADQNVTTKIFNGSASYNFGLNQFNPFVPEKNRLGRWYESFRVGLKVNGSYRLTNTITQKSTSYTDYNIAGLDNSPTSVEDEREKLRLEQLLAQPGLSDEERAQYEAELEALSDPIIKDFNEILKNGVMNTSYSVPITLPNFKIARFLNLTPSISYRGDMFTKSLQYGFLNPTSGTEEYLKDNGKIVYVSLDEQADSISYSYDENGNLSVILNPNSGGVVINDTISRPAFGQSYAFGTSINTRLYGTYRFNGKRLQAIRHTIAPTLSISYRPSSDGQYSQRVQVREDSSGAYYKYLPRFLVGNRSSGGTASGSLSFGISNQLEAKVRSKSDTSETEFEKVSIIDNFNISGNYNLLAKKAEGDFALSNININASTTIIDGLININLGGSFDPYAYVVDDVVQSNKAGRKIPVYKWQKSDYDGSGGNYLSNFNIGINTRLSPKTFDKSKETGREINEEEEPGLAAMERFVRANPLAYVDFSIPWSVNIRYSLSYRKQGLADPRVVQALQVQGDFNLTQKWKITYSTGWDFVFKEVTLTNIGLMRELHCWDMGFNWTPISGNSRRAGNYSFDLRVRSSLLADLKLSRRRVYYDRGGF